MATRARPLLLCLCLCFASSCLSSAVDAAAAAGNGYRTTAFLVDDEGRRLRAELVAGGGGGNTAYGGDVQRLDVYARLLAAPVMAKEGYHPSGCGVTVDAIVAVIGWTWLCSLILSHGFSTHFLSFSVCTARFSNC
ncbi:hypothetical protein OsJ_22348 [Oryza sativa Japonica Group]|uniref:Uncharacterized protein n=1 Tax=Oryza sativa subsp. japonica TaxID=39947 RepID=B9FQH1_ORYSJ|nr:hypothetical protein OsJ_22348 [Oryza sativa Japonica Group]